MRPKQEFSLVFSSNSMTSVLCGFFNEKYHPFPSNPFLPLSSVSPPYHLHCLFSLPLSPYSTEKSLLWFPLLLQSIRPPPTLFSLSSPTYHFFLLFAFFFPYLPPLILFLLLSILFSSKIPLQILISLFFPAYHLYSPLSPPVTLSSFPSFSSASSFPP